MALLKYSTKMMFFAIMNILLFSNVLGVPVLNTSIGSELSGRLCPGTITFTCNAINFGTNGLIDWYINNTLLARYFYNTNTVFPYTVPLESSILNASVQISSSTFENDQYNFLNFTLTVNLNELFSFQGYNVTCGTDKERSNIINIDNFTIEGSVKNISYLAKYHGAEGELEEVSVQWIDQLQLSMCKITTSYIVQLLSNKGEISRMILSTRNCTNGECSVQFSSNFINDAKSYEIIVKADNHFIEDRVTSFNTTIRNTTRNSIDFNECNRTASITCSTSINENCSVILTDSTSLAVLIPGESDQFTFNTTNDNIHIIITIDSITLNQTFVLDRDGDTVNGVLLPVGIAVFTLGCIIAIGCLLGIIIFCKVQICANQDYRYMLWVTLLISIIVLIFIVTLVLWIIVGSTSSLDICGNNTLYSFPILLTSVIFSFTFVFGVMILGGFTIALCWCSENKEKEYFCEHAVIFGRSKPNSKSDMTNNCNICSKKFTSESNENSMTQSATVKSSMGCICFTCYQWICTECCQQVYVKYCKTENNVCRTCYQKYQSEQEEMRELNLHLIGRNKPRILSNNNMCHECGGEVKESRKRKLARKICPSRVSCCCTCGHLICDECFHANKIYVEYLHQEMEVCLNCYAIFKMTS